MQAADCMLRHTQLFIFLTDSPRLCSLEPNIGRLCILHPCPHKTGHGRMLNMCPHSSEHSSEKLLYMAIASTPPAEDSPAEDGLRPSAVQAPTPGESGNACSNQPTQRQRSCSGVGQVPEHPRPAMPTTTADVSRGARLGCLDQRHYSNSNCNT